MKAQVISNGVPVDVAITKRRWLAKKLCVLVVFGPENAQWMSVDDKLLILDKDQRKQISHLPWWDRKSRG